VDRHVEPKAPAGHRDPRRLVGAARIPAASRRALEVVSLHHLTFDKLDVLSAELASCVGEHDFAGFRGASDRRIDTIRTIECADVSVSTDLSPLVLIDVTGTGFMYNMVRILVGTAVDVARRRKPVGSIAKTLASRVRTDAGITAPPDGLCLMRTEIDLPNETADD
jgi:tRNA pseudouridine38-40 synthase